MSKGHLPKKLNKSGGLDVDCQEDAIDANDTETNRRAALSFWRILRPLLPVASKSLVRMFRIIVNIAYTNQDSTESISMHIVEYFPA